MTPREPLTAARQRAAGIIPTMGAIAPGAGVRRVVSSPKAWDYLISIVAVAGIALLAVRRWLLIGPYPPGLDGAQWVAIGRGLHRYGRSTDGAYAPLVPVLATMGDAIAGPLPTIRVLAILSALAVAIAVWTVARAALGVGWGSLTAALVIPASALAEPVLYGGYPQQFALAAGVIALWTSCRYLATGNRRLLWPAALGMLLAGASHHIYGPIVALSVVVAAGLWVSSSHDADRIGRVRSLALALAPGCAVAALVLLTLNRAGYSPPLDASARAALDAWRYATRESPEIWAAITIAGMVSLAILWRRRGEAAWLVAAALMLPAGLLFLVFGQPRLVPPVIIGAALAAGLGARRLAVSAEAARAAPAIATAAVALVLIVPADRAVAQLGAFYRVSDASLLGAARAIAEDGLPGAVAVRQDRRGWPVGWWFEALLERPVIVGSDPRWLAFPEESEHARVAEALFAGDLDAAEFRDRAASVDVRYLVTRKWDWIGWERWTSDPAFPIVVVYDDDEYLALRVR
jgi:hypothetical protein